MLKGYTFEMKANDLPWTVPVPIKKSSFVPLNQKHKKFNVEVDLSRIATFTDRLRPIRSDQLLYSDLQTNTDVNLEQRLGSGRSGFFRGKYLKGVGRTLLAGNWNAPIDLYHSSGLLLSTAAIREYLISNYFESKNAAHLINPCEGILFKKTPKSFFNHSRRIFKGTFDIYGVKTPKFAPVDSLFQAITIKNGGFCRFSNMTWWLDHFPQYHFQDERAQIAFFFEIFYEALEGFSFLKSKKNLDADEIAMCFARTVEKSIHFFMDVWSMGIGWGSFHNNFTIDGRFLDLETPSIYPYPLVGVVLNGVKVKDRQKTISTNGYQYFQCFEVIHYIRQIQYFLSFLRMKLKFLVENNLILKNEKIFTNDFLERLTFYFDKNHPIFSQKRLSDIIVSKIESRLHLSKREAREVEHLLSFALRHLNFLNHRNYLKPSPEIKLFRVDTYPMAQSEPNFRPAIFVPKFIRDRDMSIIADNQKLNESIIEAESKTKLDSLMVFLKSLEKRK